MNFADVINLDTPSGNIKKISVGGIDLWSAPVADLFVASWGSDTTGDGSVTNPFKTVTAAYNAASNDDVIMLLTDITDNFQNANITKKFTICGLKKSIVFKTDGTKLIRSGGNITIKNLTITSNYRAGTDAIYGLFWANGGILTVENVHFTNCNFPLSGARNHAYCIVASGSTGAKLYCKDVSIDNSTVEGLIQVRNYADAMIENITCGENCHFVGWTGSAQERGRLINLDSSAGYWVRKYSNIILRDGCDADINGYYSNIQILVDHVYGDGNLINISAGGFYGVLSDIYITGKIDCQKTTCVNGLIRGSISVVDTKRTAADGNVMFEGYGGYQITQEDFASMTWGGAEGFHLSLENNKILLRVDA